MQKKLILKIVIYKQKINYIYKENEDKGINNKKRINLKK